MLTLAYAINVPLVLNHIATILVIGIALKVLSDKTKLPFVVLLVLSGTLLASTVYFNIEALGFLPELLRVLALIIVVFVNGFYLKLDTIKKESGIVLPLATIGVVLTALIITAITYFVLGLPLLPAAFMGALLSGTDPAALSELLKKGGRIQTIINSESILNQPLTIIMPLILFDFIVAAESPLEVFFGSVGKFIMLVGVGLVVGIIGYLAGKKLLKMLPEDLEVVAGLMIALGVYVLAENFLGSGILAVGIASILLSSAKVPKKHTITSFNKELALIFTIFVFMMLGMEFSLQNLAQLTITRIDILAVLFAVLVARFVTVHVLTYKSDLVMRDRMRLSLVSPKGMAPAALAPLVFLMAASSDLVTLDSAFTVVKIVYLTIIISVLASVFIFKATETD